MAATSPFSHPAPEDHPPGGRARAPERDLAHLVAPLVADALALGRRIERCPPPNATESDHPAPPQFALFADQLRAAAVLMGECVSAVDPWARARQADAPLDGTTLDGTAPAHDAPAPLGGAFRQLLADEDRMARRLRRAIATCDRRGDDWTADRLEEVLDEVLWQRRQLEGLVPTPSQ